MFVCTSRVGRSECLVSLSVGCTTLGHGSTSGLGGVLFSQLHEMHDTPVTTDQISWASSIMSPTLLVGAWLVTPVMGRLGRRVAHLTVTAPALLGWLLIAYADTFTLIIVGRTLQGVSFGMMLALRSTLIGEYTSPEYRGPFLGTISLAQGFGVLFVHLIGTFFHWRTTCLFCCLFHVVSLVIIFFTPESPSWLAEKEKFERCKKAFKLLRGDQENKELDKLIRAKSIVNDTEKIKKMSDVIRVIKKKEFYKPVILMLHVYAIGELTSLSIIATYPTIVLTVVVSPNIDFSFWTLMMDINRVLSSMFFIYVSRRIKRKVLMVSACGISIVNYLVIACYMYTRSFGILGDNVWLSLVLLQAANVSFVFALGTPYIIAGEIFPLRYRSVGGSISVLSMSAVFFVVVKTFPGLVSTVGLGYTYVIYAGILTYFFIVISVFLPETKDKTLLQIEEEFIGKTVDVTATKNDETLTSVNPSETLLEVPSDHNTEEDSRFRLKL